MREILFRGKVIDSDNCHRLGEWVYGYFVNCASEYDDPEKDRVPEIIEVDADRIYAGEYSTWDVHKVAIKTVTQWTGLVDKNGKKIFEGDVVKEEHGGQVRAGWTYEVEYNETHASFLLLAKHKNGLSYFPFDEFNAARLEVIGNIWDNPELVERKE